MRILLIEDSPAYRELLTAIAGKLGLEADATSSGEEALTRLVNGRYDLAIIDYHLPGIDGLQLCRRIRKLKGGELIPLILLTSDPDQSLQRKAFEAGITEILHKTEATVLQRELSTFIMRTRHVFSGRILYVEDSLSVAELTKAQLLDAGFEVTHFSTADDALAAFLSGEFDLVLSDIVVEGQLSGIGLLRAIRALDEHRRETPFLAISGGLDDQRKVAILRQGADDFVAKPVLQEELLARIAHLITRKQLLDQVMEQQETLRQMAITDGLTGLYNKTYLHETASQMLSSALRHRYPLSTIVLDLDFFKKVNDQHGHDVGDKVLRAIGDLLKNSCRREDMPGRFGGEEFVVILPRCSLSNARMKAETLRAEIEALHPAGLRITTSIGVTCTTKDQLISFTDLFKQADEAVYEAKANGRNQVVTYSPVLRNTA